MYLNTLYIVNKTTDWTELKIWHMHLLRIFMQSKLGHLENINVKNLCPVSRKVGKQITITGVYTAKYQDISMMRNWDSKRKQLNNTIVRYFRRRPSRAKQTTTTTATRTSPNKRFNEENNSCARALWSEWSLYLSRVARYKSLYISLPSSATQEREMTKFYVIWGTRTTAAIFFVFPFEIKRGHCIFSLSKTRCHTRCRRGFFFYCITII